MSIHDTISWIAVEQRPAIMSLHPVAQPCGGRLFFGYLVAVGLTIIACLSTGSTTVSAILSVLCTPYTQIYAQNGTARLG